MDRFHTNICNTLFNHFKDGLTPPITTEEESKELMENIKLLVLNSNLHVFDSGDVIWSKLRNNKRYYPYFEQINFN